MLGKNGENSFAYLFGVELRSEADFEYPLDKNTYYIENYK